MLWPSNVDKLAVAAMSQVYVTGLCNGSMSTQLQFMCIGLTVICTRCKLLIYNRGG